MIESILAKLFARLGVVVMERRSEGTFEMLSSIPDWFSHLYLDTDTGLNESRKPKNCHLF